jgi:hypothetical protein
MVFGWARDDHYMVTASEAQIEVASIWSPKDQQKTSSRPLYGPICIGPAGAHYVVTSDLPVTTRRPRGSVDEGLGQSSRRRLTEPSDTSAPPLTLQDVLERVDGAAISEPLHGCVFTLGHHGVLGRGHQACY